MEIKTEKKKNKEKEHYLRLGRIPPVSAHTLFNRAAHRTTLSRTRSPTCGPHLAAAFPRAHVGPSLRYTGGFAADNMGPLVIVSASSVPPLPLLRAHRSRPAAEIRGDRCNKFVDPDSPRPYDLPPTRDLETVVH